MHPYHCTVMSLIGKKSVPLLFRMGQRSQVRHGTSIPVILTKDVDSRGNEGEVVNVKRGFARNYLIPRKMAGKICCCMYKFDVRLVIVETVFGLVYATKENKTKFVKSSDVKDLKFQLSLGPVETYVVSLGNNKSVTPSDIRRTLESKGLVIDRKAIIATEAPIVAAGEYVVKVGAVDVKLQVTA